MAPLLALFLASAMEVETAMSQPVLLALPGPAFPNVNFDKGARSCVVEGADEGAEGREHLDGVRFVVSGKPLFLDQSVPLLESGCGANGC